MCKQANVPFQVKQLPAAPGSSRFALADATANLSIMPADFSAAPSHLRIFTFANLLIYFLFQ